MNEITRRVGPKGQVTLPAVIRCKLGIRPRDRVAFRLENRRVEITLAPPLFEERYQAIPALRPARSWKEIEAQIAERIALDAASEWLGESRRSGNSGDLRVPGGRLVTNVLPSGHGGAVHSRRAPGVPRATASRERGDA